MAHQRSIKRTLDGVVHRRLSPEPWLQTLIQAAQQVLFDTMSLDIEFAVDHSGEVFLLQVRPLCTGLSPTVTDELARKHYRKDPEKVTKLNLEHPDLAGDGTIFGLMPDWNPAGIGVKPKPLALSILSRTGDRLNLGTPT